MSALHKLAVARDVGTSRPASAALGRKSQDDLGADTLQQVQSHPLLQSLGIGLPVQLQTAGRSPQQPQHRPSSMKATTGAFAGSSNLQLGCALPPANAHLTARSHAAAALAQALRQDPALLLDSGSAQELLATLALKQQRKQLLMHQSSSISNPKQQLRAGAMSIFEGSARKSNDKCFSKFSATTAGCMQPQQHVVRPVTPHMTKPYKVSVAKQLSRKLSATQGGSCEPAATAWQDLNTSLLHQHATDIGPNWTASTSSSGALHAAGPVGSALRCPCGAAEQLAAAATIRPGSAAAARLLRSFDGGMACYGKRPGSALASTAAHRAMADNKRTQLHQQEQQLPQVTGPFLAQGVLVAAVQDERCSTATAKSQQGPAPESTDPRVQEKEQPHHQGSETNHCSRPSTAYLRSMLLSSSGADAGIAERLAFYAHINSSNDAQQGVDIVYEMQAEDAPGGIPDWLANDHSCSAVAVQAAPMVLNLEDLAQSTAEVLEQELDGLTMSQLQQLKSMLDGGH